MKITRVDTYKTLVFSMVFNGHEYTITHREDADGYIVPVWEVKDEENDELAGGELRTSLIQMAYDYINDKKLL